MELYKTVDGEGCTEEIIKKSKFICWIKNIKSFQEGRDFVDEIRQRHKDATHNVPAIVFGDKQEHQWMSDDGEPQGTAGAPILKMVVDEGLTNIVIVVTRYFGGIKLGTGGLVRAYQGIAKKALAEIGKVQVSEGYTFICIVDYSNLSVLRNISCSGKFEIEDERFTERVELKIICKIEDLNDVKKTIMDITSGHCEFREEKKIFISRKIS